MASNVTIEKVRDKIDGPLVGFGVNGLARHERPEIPSSFTRRAVYPDLGLDVVIECSFSGDKIEVHRLDITRAEVSISTRDLTQLSLPWVIREVAKQVIPYSYRWSVFLQDTSDMETAKRTGPSDETLLYVAGIYWFEHVAWGAPRATIMEYFGISRTTANAWIKKAAKLHSLPGVHAGGAGGEE